MPDGYNLIAASQTAVKLFVKEDPNDARTGTLT